jgi:subtilase family serine protease
MRRLRAASVGLMLLFAATLASNAQTPDPSQIHARPLISAAKVPETPSGPTGITPEQYKSAYGFNQIRNLGQGQTIAVIDAYDDPNIASDLSFYASYFHLTPCNFQKVKIGNPQQGQGWDLAESLGVEQACALAPEANIILVEATSSSFTDLLTAVATASSAPYNATVVSMGWGGGEFSGESEYDSYFCNIVNGNGQPVTFVAVTDGVIYPAASPCVIAVGGTTLVLSSVLPPADPLQIDYGTESALGMGGISAYEPELACQVQACAPYSPDGHRCLPDVAADASAAPASNVPVYDTYSYNGWVQVGGTGVSTAAWSAFLTLVNSGRAMESQNTLSQADCDMYTIYYSSNYLTDFHDIGGMDYDLTTGIGSYQANNLFLALVGETN